MLHPGVQSRSTTGNVTTEVGSLPLRQDAHDAVRVDSSGMSLLPELSLRPITLRFSMAYYATAILTSAPLLLADLAALWIANACAVAVVTNLGGSELTVAGVSCLPFALLLIQPVVGLFLELLPGVGLSPAEELRRTSVASTLWALPLLCVSYVKSSDHPGVWSALALTWILALVTVPTLRGLARWMVSGQFWWGQSALIFGGGAEGAALYRRLLANPMRGLRPWASSTRPMRTGRIGLSSRPGIWGRHPRRRRLPSGIRFFGELSPRWNAPRQK